MDTTYRWRKFWYMVFRDPDTQQNLLWYKVKYETVEQYKVWIRELQASWVEITWIVCDGRRWLLWGFWNIPTQMCQYHQKQIVIRNITRRPKLEANRELKDIALLLWKISSNVRIQWLENWYQRNKRWLHERNEKHWYTHIRTLRARKSLHRNIQYLFVHEKFDYIPCTSNSLEWAFSRLKQKLRNHRWLTQWRREKYIERYLWNR